MEAAIFQALAGNEYAPWELLVYDYRKEFGLSWKQWCEEPIDVFLTNLTVVNAKRKYEEKLNKRAEREARRAK